MTNLVEWFDPNNRDHVAAYRHLQTTGIWPDGFIPPGMEIPTYWNISVAGKLADAWINHMLEGDQ